MNWRAKPLHDNTVFEALLTLVIRDNEGHQTTITSVRQAMGIPDLDQPLKAMNVDLGSSFPTRLIGLLGREFLRHATMTYRGSKGIVEIVLDLESFPRPQRS